VRREPAEGFQSLSEIVGGEEIGEVLMQLLMVFVMVALHGCLFECSVHSLDLAIGPRVIWFGQPMFDAMTLAGPLERMAPQHRGWAFAVLRQIGELDPVVGQDHVDLVRDGLDQSVEKGDRSRRIGFLEEPGKGDFRGAVDCDEEIEFAFLGSDFGDVDVKEADGIALELFLGCFLAFDFGQPGDAVALQAAVERRASQAWDCGLQGIETVVERKQGVLAESDDDCLLEPSILALSAPSAHRLSKAYASTWRRSSD
jgi:hypothetical protein